MLAWAHQLSTLAENINLWAAGAGLDRGNQCITIDSLLLGANPTVDFPVCPVLSLSMRR